MAWKLQIEQRLQRLQASVQPFSSLISDYQIISEKLTLEQRKSQALKEDRIVLSETNAYCVSRDVKRLTEIQERVAVLNSQVTLVYEENIKLVEELMQLRRIVSDRRMELDLKMEVKETYGKEIERFGKLSQERNLEVQSLAKDNGELLQSIATIRKELDQEIEKSAPIKKANDECLSAILNQTTAFADRLNEINDMSGKLPPRLIDEYDVIQYDEELQAPKRSGTALERSTEEYSPMKAKRRFEEINQSDQLKIDFGKYMRKSVAESYCTLKPIHAWLGHELDVSEALLTAEGKLYTASGDSTVKSWDSASAFLIREYKSMSGSLLCLDVNDRLLCAGGSNASIVLWNLQKSKPINMMTGHSSRVTATRFLGSAAATVSHDCTLKLWDLNRAYYRESFDIESHGACLCLLGENLATGVSGGVVQIWNRGSKRKASQVEVGESAVTSVALSADSNTLVVNSKDSKVRLLDLRTMKVRFSLTHKGECYADYINGSNYNRASISPSNLIAAGGSDGKVFIWTATKGATAKVLQHQKFLITCCSWEDNKLCIADSRGGLVLWG